MWPNSIRWRLTLWYAGVLFASLLAFGFGVERYFTRAMEANRDAALRRVLDVLAGSLQHEVIEHGGQEAGEKSFSEVAGIHARTFRNYQWQLSRGGLMIGASGTLRPGTWPAQPGEYLFTGIAHESRRGATLFRLAGESAIYQVAAVDQQSEWETAAALLRRALLVAIPLVVLLSAVGGYALAVRSFRPVVAMADTARRLEAHDLRERLPVQNPADELGKLAQTLNHLLDRVSTVIHGQRDFMADAAHDLRTPVSIARTAAQTVLEQPSNDGRTEREALGLVEHQMARVSRMVSDLLFLARSDSGEIQLRREAYYLDELLRELESTASVLCRPKGILITTESDIDVQGTGDVHLLQQMLLILVENAIQHSPSGGRIRVTARRLGQRAEICVADEGPGVPPADRARIFDRFYRGRQGEGTGLGLAIARRVAQAHSGTLTLADTAALGSVFQVEIALTV